MLVWSCLFLLNIVSAATKKNIYKYIDVLRIKSQFNEQSNQIDYMMIYGYSFHKIKSLMEAFYFLTGGNVDLRVTASAPAGTKLMSLKEGGRIYF